MIRNVYMIFTLEYAYQKTGHLMVWPSPAHCLSGTNCSLTHYRKDALSESLVTLIWIKTSNTK